MGRSNPQQNSNPAQRFYEWDGQSGQIRYYDKEQKQNIPLELPFTFLLIEQAAKITGWNDQSDSAIFSNEILQTNEDQLIVKAHKGGELCRGLYAEIKESVKSKGGNFTASLYIACKDDNDQLYLANLSLKGKALSAWMDFRKESGMKVWDNAVTIDSYTEGSKGSITYRMPSFKLREIAPETNEQAKEMDRQLQEFLQSKKMKVEPEQAQEQPAEQNDTFDDKVDNDDDLPF